MIHQILSGILIGAVATLAMDVWAVVLNRATGLPLPNWANVGRWFWHLRRGRVFHDDIAAAAPYDHELSLGWFAHYAIGILYGVGFVLIIGPAWLIAPTFLPAWVFSILTVGAGWFLLQPGMGLGWAAARTPNPWRTRALNLVAHTVFAFGLWGGALLIAQAP